MTRKWSLFTGAVILAGYILVSYGAPPLAIVGGIGLAALYTGRRAHVV